MIFHVVDPTKNAATTFPFAENTGVVLCFVPCSVLLAGEATFGRLRTTFVATEEMLAVPVVVFAEIAAPCEDGVRRATWVGTAPGPIGVLEAVVCKITWVWGARP